MNKKLTLEINEDVINKLEVLRKDSNSKDIVVVIRKALAVYEILVKAQQDGGKVYIHLYGDKQEIILPEDSCDE